MVILLVMALIINNKRDQTSDHQLAQRRVNVGSSGKRKLGNQIEGRFIKDGTWGPTCGYLACME